MIMGQKRPYLAKTAHDHEDRPEGLTTGAEVTGDVSVDCDVVIVGSGPAGRRWRRSWPRRAWTWW